MSKSLSDNRFDGKSLDLDQMFSNDWDKSFDNPSISSEYWLDAFERKHLLTDQQADEMFKRIEADTKKFPI